MFLALHIPESLELSSYTLNSRLSCTAKTTEVISKFGGRSFQELHVTYSDDDALELSTLELLLFIMSHYLGILLASPMFQFLW
jgi:hypothetical protein